MKRKRRRKCYTKSTPRPPGVRLPLNRVPTRFVLLSATMYDKEDDRPGGSPLRGRCMVSFLWGFVLQEQLKKDLDLVTEEKHKGKKPPKIDEELSSTVYLKAIHFDNFESRLSA